MNPRTNRVVLVTVLAVAVVACGPSALSQEELDQLAEPLVTAHDALEDMQFQIESGISRGGFLDLWPTVAVEVRRGLDDFEESLTDDIPEGDLKDLEAYAEEIRATTEYWTDAASATRAFVFEDGPEAAMSDAMFRAQVSFLLLDPLKDAALTPGATSDTSDPVEDVFSEIESGLE